VAAISHADHRPHRIQNLTALNLATSAAFRRCDGRHIPSGETVSRIYPATIRVLPVCARCGVPYGGPRTTWNGVSKPD
jgi:hypothetical protein